MGKIKCESDLIALNFTLEELARIESVPEFVEALNNFTDAGHSFVPAESGISFNPTTKNIAIDPREEAGIYRTFSCLAHELGHYSGSYQPKTIDYYPSAREYAAARAIAEGEAIYNEFFMIQKYIEYTGDTKNTDMSVDKYYQGSLYSYVINNNLNLSKDDFVQEISKVAFIAQPSTDNSGFTYYPKSVKKLH